jgi:uncharacterized protein YjiS (DUF1127 family)
MRANHLQSCYVRPADTRRHAALSALGDAAQRIVAVLRLWRCRQRDRRQLTKFAQLDDRILADIGLTRGGAEDEATSSPRHRIGARPVAAHHLGAADLAATRSIVRILPLSAAVSRDCG